MCAPRPAGRGAQVCENQKMPKTTETPSKDALRELLETRQYKALRAKLAVLKPAPIAELLADLSEDEAMMRD